MEEPFLKSPDGITKWCPECKSWLPVESFHRSKKAPDGYQDYCALCSRARYKAWRDANKDAANAALRERRKRPGVRQRDNETQNRYYKNKARFAKYGLTKDDYLRLIEAQGNRCPVCLREYDWDEFPLFIDHDHATGVVRGVLCGPCNRGLGHFYDDPARLARAIEYLKLAAEGPGLP